MGRTCCVVLLALALPARAGSGGFALLPAELPPRILPRIVNGIVTAEFPTTGALLDRGDFATASLLCSGTLIGCQTFLTAGHCVESDLDPAHYSVFFQHAGFFHVQSIALHPAYSFPVADVAVLKLTTAVTGVSPTPINATAAVAPGTPATIAGFGRTGGVGFDYGLKRYGAVTTATCPIDLSDTASVCWNFDNPLGPPGSDSNTCNGDSGGPLFVDLGGGALVAGVTSGGYNADCLPDDVAFDTNVFTYASYIQTEGGADLANTTCGSIPQVGGPDTTTFSASGQVSAGSPEGRHTVSVGAGMSRLRVAMNALDDGGANFDLYVQAGSPPTTTSYDCRQNGTSQYAFCEFTSPTPGTWHILVERATGVGAYQVTATTFGTDCSNPANVGRPCDDGSGCTTGDVCQSGGTCAGIAVADGSACSDGNICTRNDQCQGGACVSGAAPAIGCRQPFLPGRGLLQLRDNALNNGHDRLSWKWAAGRQTDKSEFGNPTTTSSLGLCVYDETADVPQLMMQTTIPAGAAWLDLSTGYRYLDRKVAIAGIRSLVLKAGADGRATITVKGQGAGLNMIALPLHQQSQVIVQLVGDNACWEAHYSTHRLNQADQFKAHAD